MKIVRMTSDDAEAVSSLDKRCFFDMAWSKNAFEGEMKNSIAVYFVAKNDDKVIGYAGFWHAVDEADITNIAVDEEYRRRGVGSALLETLIKCADEMGCTIVTLEVRKSNTAAQALYTKFGFKTIGFRKRYYSDTGEDAFIMTLVLKPSTENGE